MHTFRPQLEGLEKRDVPSVSPVMNDHAIVSHMESETHNRMDTVINPSSGHQAAHQAEAEEEIDTHEPYYTLDDDGMLTFHHLPEGTMLRMHVGELDTLISISGDGALPLPLEKEVRAELIFAGEETPLSPGVHEALPKFVEELKKKEESVEMLEAGLKTEEALKEQEEKTKEALDHIFRHFTHFHPIHDHEQHDHGNHALHQTHLHFHKKHDQEHDEDHGLEDIDDLAKKTEELYQETGNTERDEKLKEKYAEAVKHELHALEKKLKEKEKNHLPPEQAQKYETRMHELEKRLKKLGVSEDSQHHDDASATPLLIPASQERTPAEAAAIADIIAQLAQEG